MTKPDSPDHEERAAVAREFDRALDAARLFASGLVGLPSTEAIARVENYGLRPRIVDLEDPTGGWITADLQLDRVTLFLRASVVERATAG